MYIKSTYDGLHVITGTTERVSTVGDSGKSLTDRNVREIVRFTVVFALWSFRKLSNIQFKNTTDCISHEQLTHNGKNLFCNSPTSKYDKQPQRNDVLPFFTPTQPVSD